MMWVDDLLKAGRQVFGYGGHAVRLVACVSEHLAETAPEGTGEVNSIETGKSAKRVAGQTSGDLRVRLCISCAMETRSHGIDYKQD